MTTTQVPQDRAANDLVRRNFLAHAPNQLFVADITFVPTAAGLLFLAVVLDSWSRRIVGWAVSRDLKTALVLDALELATVARKWDRRNPSFGSGIAIHVHSLRQPLQGGGRATLDRTGRRCVRQRHVRELLRYAGVQLLDRRRFRSHSEAQIAVFRFIEGFYNQSRRHSAISYLSPIEFEEHEAPARRKT